MANGPTLDKGPWILTLDNIFLDCARKIPDNSFLEKHGITPGLQYTATNDSMKQVAAEIFKMEDSLSTTVGGCAMNTARAANFYLQALNFKNKVLTVGSIG